MMDVGLADRLRSRGLNAVEVDGWQTRGRTYATFAPRGSVNHHTAGALTGNAPSLGICINGRSDLPGPLCQAFQARDNTIYVVAAGTANHAGPGGWQDLAGNASVHGLEVENYGRRDAAGNIIEPFREDQIDTMAKVHAAFLTAPGSSGDAALNCQHYEWTKTKVDALGVDGDHMRSRIAMILNPIGLPPEVEMSSASCTTDDGHWHFFGQKGDTLYELEWDLTQWVGPKAFAVLAGAHSLSASAHGNRIDFVCIDPAGKLHQGFRQTDAVVKPGDAKWTWASPPGDWD